MDSTNTSTTVISVDVRGEHCPTPVVELSHAIAGAGPGQTVEVWSDDPSSRIDIPVWCRMKRHELLGVRDAEGAQVYTVRRTG